METQQMIDVPLNKLINDYYGVRVRGWIRNTTLGNIQTQPANFLVMVPTCRRSLIGLGGGI